MPGLINPKMTEQTINPQQSKVGVHQSVASFPKPATSNFQGMNVGNDPKSGIYYCKHCAPFVYFATTKRWGLGGQR
jgi:hypothetical protein